MSLSSTPASERTHIAFFGRRNAGKSSLINAVTGQSLSIVSEEKGTTTDPVKKTMELLPLGPVVIIDTAGVDDIGSLGEKRIEKTYEVLNTADIAVIVTDEGIGEYEEKLIREAKKRKIPYLVCYNKADLVPHKITTDNEVAVSAVTGEGVNALKEKLARLIVPKTTPLISDLLTEGDTVVLVTPIDDAAPKGRLILPQQMVLRDILDSRATAVVCQTQQLKSTLEGLKNPPMLIVCDSQAFGKVSETVPEEIPLTSFSIIMLRYKLGLSFAKEAAKALDSLKNGDRVLISEGCTHHRQCGDIGTVKLPAWIEKYTGVRPVFEFTSGGEFPADPSGYALVVHCGACMLPDSAVRSRMLSCREKGVPFSNYGIIISKVHGILDRALKVFE